MPIATTPQITLNNGVAMPALGLGVFQSPPDETLSAVTIAIADGYRLIDTAAAYGKEREVGEGIRRSGVDRGEVFVTTKLWISDYGYDSALVAFDASLCRLGVEYLDLYLLHQPVPSNFGATIASYKAAERLLAEGQVRAIGVCNHSSRHLERLISQSEVTPAINQVELHPYFTQQNLRAVHTQHGITSQAWSPLGGVNVYRPADPDHPKNPLQDPVILDLASRHDKTPAQVILRWHVDHGWSAIPKSVHAPRINENLDVFDFALTADEVAAIDALDTGVRGGPDPETVDPARYPFKVEN